jgi:hypothetical protein
MKGKFAKATVLVAALAATGYLGGRLLYVNVYAQSKINVRPYVMEYDNIAVHDGVEEITGRTTELRRSDGAMSSVITRYPTDGARLPGPKGNIVFRNAQFTDGRLAFISDEAHAKSTARRPALEQARHNAETFFSRVGPDCREKGVSNETIEGTETLFGHPAVRLSVLTAKDGLSREVMWRLPEFNCVIAQNYLQKRDNQSAEWKTNLGNRLTAFTATDPDPAFFTNWLGYDEMKPSDIGRKIAIAQGLTPETCRRCFSPDPSDANYRKWQIEK